MSLSAPRLLPDRRDPRRRFAAKWILAYLVVLVASSALLARTITGSEDVEAWRQSASWLVVVSVVFGVVAIRSYLRFDATEESERRQLRAIRPQLINSTPSRITIRRSESVAEYRDTVRRLFDGEPAEQSTVRESLGEFRRAWGQTTRRVPGLSMRLLYEAVLILVFGAIVILPVSWWSGGEPLGFPTSVPAIGGELMGLFTAFPGGELLSALFLVGIISLGSVLWTNWLAVAITLIAGAAVIAWLDRETSEDLSVVLYPDRRGLAFGLVAFVASVYVAGAVPNAVISGIGNAFGVGWAGLFGTGVGLLSAGAVAVIFVHRAVTDLRERLVYQQARPGENTHAVAAYLVARKVWGLIGLACLPILLAYAAVAIGTGQIVDVGLELTRAPWYVQVSILTVVGAAIFLAAQNYPDAAGDLRDAFRRAASSQLVRGVVFARGIPIFAIIFGFGVAWPILGFLPAAGIGILAGALARLFTLAWEMSKYRFVDLAPTDRGVSEVVIEAFTVTDADGHPIYIARVDGDELAHREKDTLVEIVLSVTESRFDDGETRPSFARYYYKEATGHGHVDIGYVADEYKADIKTRVKASLRDSDGEMEVETMDEEMSDEYSEPAYRKCLRELERRNEIDVRHGEYVLH